MSNKSLPRPAVSHNHAWRGGPALAAMDAAFDRAFIGRSGDFRAWRLALVLLILPAACLGGLALLIFGAVAPGRRHRGRRRFCIPCQLGRHCGRCSCCS